MKFTICHMASAQTTGGPYSLLPSCDGRVSHQIIRIERMSCRAETTANPVIPRMAAGPLRASGSPAPCSRTEKMATPLNSMIIVTTPSAVGSSKYHPGLPVSCSRRHPAASMGTTTASWKTGVKTCTPSPVSGSTPNNEVSSTAKTTLTRIMNKTNHQYSERAARPAKTKYLLRHVLIASMKPIFRTP